MAKIAPSANRRIDHLLDALTHRWERLPAVEAEIDRWDLLEQIDFVEEWPLTEHKLAELAGCAADCQLSPGQATRYAELLDLIGRNRPIIARLQQS